MHFVWHFWEVASPGESPPLEIPLGNVSAHVLLSLQSEPPLPLAACV